MCACATPLIILTAGNNGTPEIINHSNHLKVFCLMINCVRNDDTQGNCNRFDPILIMIEKKH